MTDLVSYPARLRQLAAERPDAPAVTCGQSAVDRAELDDRSERLAVRLQALGVGVGDMVTIVLPNSIEWFVATVACWKVGAVPQPVSARLPAR